jgi:hypothetical protein
MGRRMTKEAILTLKEPFIFTELETLGISMNRKELSRLVKEGKLNQKKVGRMNLYWKKETEDSLASGSEPNDQTGFQSYIKQLELDLDELKQELMAEREKVRKLHFQEGIDEPWKEAAMAMARILSEQRQVSMQEVLEYFNAPIE